MRKRDELADPGSCLGKAEDDEPLFVLRAKDPLSSTTVRAWAEYAAKSGLHERGKIDEARVLRGLVFDVFGDPLVEVLAERRPVKFPMAGDGDGATS